MDVLTGIFCALGVLLLLFAIPLMVDVLPASVGGLLRAKEVIHFENTMSLSRERDRLAFLLLPLFLVALAYFRVLPARLIAESPASGAFGWTTLFLLLYLLSRNLSLRLLGPKMDDHRAFQVISHSFFTFYVLLCALMLMTYILLLPFHLTPETVTFVFRCEIEGMYLIFLIRKIQLLRTYQSWPKTLGFTLLLEFLPASILTALLFFF